MFFEFLEECIEFFTVMNGYFRRTLSLKLSVLFESDTKGSFDETYIITMCGIAVFVFNQNCAKLKIFGFCEI